MDEKKQTVVCKPSTLQKTTRFNKHIAIIHKKGSLSSNALLVLQYTYFAASRRNFCDEVLLIPLKEYEDYLGWSHPDTPKLLSLLDEICDSGIEWNYLVIDKKNEQVWDNANKGKLKLSKTGKGKTGWMGYDHEPYERAIKIYIPGAIRDIFKKPNIYIESDINEYKEIATISSRYVAGWYDLLKSSFIKTESKRDIYVNFKITHTRILLNVKEGAYKKLGDFMKHCVYEPLNALCDFLNKKHHDETEKLEIECELIRNKTEIHLHVKDLGCLLNLPTLISRQNIAVQTGEPNQTAGKTASILQITKSTPETAAKTAIVEKINNTAIATFDTNTQEVLDELTEIFGAEATAKSLYEAAKNKFSSTDICELIKDNIKYTKRKEKDGRIKDNFEGYLREAIVNDYAKSVRKQERRILKEAQKAETDKKAKDEEARVAAEAEAFNKQEEEFMGLPEEERNKWFAKAEAQNKAIKSIPNDSKIKRGSAIQLYFESKKDKV